jgi:hypothetical protein
MDNLEILLEQSDKGLLNCDKGIKEKIDELFENNIINA